MIDNEIIKALECCVSNRQMPCNGCPLFDFSDDYIVCVSEAIKNALNLINRQRAEIEKIKNKLQYYLNINEENGVVYIPKFVVDNPVKEMTEVNENDRA